MIKTFLVSFRLKNTYRVNSIIYSLKRIPFIKKLLPSSLYKNKGLKVFANIISVIWEIVSLFLGKFLYIPLMLLVPMSFFNVDSQNAFIHIIFFLTLIGGILNTGMLSPTKDKYYAVILMKMNSTHFALSNYIYVLIRHFIGFLVTLCFFGFNTMINLSFGLCLLISLFVCSIKLIVIQYFLRDYKSRGIIHSENSQNKYTITFSIMCFICAYLPLQFQILIPIEFFYGLTMVAILLGVYSLIYVLKFDCYHRMYHQLLSTVSKMLSSSSSQMVAESYHSFIDIDTNLTSQKNGYEYFNEIFMKRHKKILWKSTIRQCYIIIVVVIITLIITCLGLVDNVVSSFTSALPYFVFVLYFLNTTNRITQAMFINCDHSMLTYAFYRSPQHILSLFKIRLREMVKMNLIPALLIGVGVSLILMINGGVQEWFHSLISIVSILCTSVFFSTHYLVLYYLLQPYNAYTEVKNPMYSICTSLTYFVCYMFINLKIPTLIFGLSTIIFCVVYCIVGCLLVYKLAPKTFKIHN